MDFNRLVQEAICLLQSALDNRFGVYRFYPTPTTGGYPAWFNDSTGTYINLTAGEVDNQVELYFDGRIEGSFRLPMYLGSDGKRWGVLPAHLATVNGEGVIFRVEQLAERKIKGLFCPTDWLCQTKRANPKGDQLLPYTKLTTPAGVLYVQKIKGWSAYLPGKFNAETGDPVDHQDRVLVDVTLDGIKKQLYELFVEGKFLKIEDLEV